MISHRDFTGVTKVDGRTLSGVAAVYGQPSRTIHEQGRSFVERIAPGAFGASIDGDIKLLYNHQTAMPLARSRSGTLTLSDSPNGLQYEASLPDTTLGNDVRALLERGDLSGEMSFGFFVDKDEWNKSKTERTVTAARLSEISIVVDAAYPQTQSSLRCVDAAKIEAAQTRLTLHLQRITKWTT